MKTLKPPVVKERRGPECSVEDCTNTAHHTIFVLGEARGVCSYCASAMNSTSRLFRSVVR